MRIWWQSFVDADASGPYLTHLADYLNRQAGPGVQVDLVGMTPPARGWSRLSELRGAVGAVRAALDAQEQGYDAFVLGHFQEPGLYEARSSVDIPVIGLGESVLLWSSTLGRRLGLVTVDSVFETLHHEQLEARGLGSRLVGVRALDATLAEFDRAFEPEGYTVLRSRFDAAAAELVAAGADVVIPAGGLFGMASAHEVGYTVDGVPVVPSVLIALEWAQMTVRITDRTGVRPSRRSSFRAAPPEAIADFRAMFSEGAPLDPHQG